MYTYAYFYIAHNLQYLTSNKMAQSTVELRVTYEGTEVPIVINYVSWMYEALQSTTQKEVTNLLGMKSSVYQQRTSSKN